MEELIFLAEKNEDGHFTARHEDSGIIKEGNTLPELRESISRLYENHVSPILVRLYFIKDRYDITFYTKSQQLIHSPF